VVLTVTCLHWDDLLLRKRLVLPALIVILEALIVGRCVQHVTLPVHHLIDMIGSDPARWFGNL